MRLAQSRTWYYVMAQLGVEARFQELREGICLFGDLGTKFAVISLLIAPKRGRLCSADVIGVRRP